MQLLNVCWLCAVVSLELSWLVTTTKTTSASAVPKEVEDNLMSLFGFKKRPKIDRSKVVIPQAMLDLYRKQTGQRLDTASIPKPGLHAKSANTVRSFTHIESPIDARFPGHHKFRLKFDLANIPRNERLKAAELTLNREIVTWLSEEGASSKDHFQHVLVNDIVKPGVKGKRRPITRLIDSKLVDIRKNHTVSLDVLPAVERWMESPKDNHGILVYVLGHGKGGKVKHVRLRRSLGEDERSWSRRQPLLFTYTDDGKNKQAVGEALAAKRARRASGKKKNRRKDQREACRRHPMYVDFTDVGWNNWIVAPPGYDAFYCHGECNFPMADHLNTTNHAIVQTLVNSVSPSKVPRACCVPTMLNSISMLYLDDENKVVLKNYKEMAVIGCGCR